MEGKIARCCAKVIRIGLLLLILLLPLVFDIGMEDAFALPKVTLFRIIILVCGIALVIKKIENRIEKQFSQNLGETVVAKGNKGFWVNFAVLVFLLVGAVATLRSPNIYLSFVGAYKFYFWGLSSIIGYVVIYFVVIDDAPLSYIEKTINLVLVGSVLVTIYGILQHFGLDFISWEQSSKERVFSTLGNPNFLGAYLIMVIPLGLSRLMIIAHRQSSCKETRRRVAFLSWIVVLLCVMLFTCLIWTLSRGAWVGFLVSLAVFGILVGKEGLHENRKWLGLVLILFGLISAIIGLPKGTRHIPEELVVNDKYTTFNEGSVVEERVASIVELREIGIAGRICAWKDTLKMIKEHPFLGIGLDTFGIVFQRYKSPKFVQIVGKNIIADYPHNEFLQVAATMGLVGLAVYLWLWFCFLTMGIRLILQSRQSIKQWHQLGTTHRNGDTAYVIRFLTPGILSSIVALLVQNQFGFTTITTSTLLWFLVGIMVAMKNWELNSDYRPATREAQLGTTKTNRLLILERKIRFVRWIVYPIMWVIGVVVIVLILGQCLGDIHFKRGLIYSKYRIWDGAIYEYQEALSFNPRQEKYRTNLGNAYKERAMVGYYPNEKRKWIEKAILAFEENIKMNPLDSYHYNDLGTAYMWKADVLAEPTVDLAINVFQKGIDLFPNFVDGLNNLAWAYSYKGMTHEAIDIWERALRIAPDDVLVNYNLGSIHANIGNHKKAVSYWRKVLEVDPSYEEAKRNLEKIQPSYKNKPDESTKKEVTNDEKEKRSF